MAGGLPCQDFLNALELIRRDNGRAIIFIIPVLAAVQTVPQHPAYRITGQINAALIAQPDLRTACALCRLIVIEERPHDYGLIFHDLHAVVAHLQPIRQGFGAEDRAAVLYPLRKYKLYPVRRSVALVLGDG